MPDLMFDKLPEAMRVSRRAVVWNHETRNGKRTKVPYVADGSHHHAAVDDPSTWRPLADAVDCVLDGKADGIGVVLGEGDGIDLDHCRNAETGEIAPWAWRIIRTLNSYTEVSPSETGVHIYARGTLPARGRRQDLPSHGDAARIEMVRLGPVLLRDR